MPSTGVGDVEGGEKRCLRKKKNLKPRKRKKNLKMKIDRLA